jgi:hypothetical protein
VPVVRSVQSVIAAAGRAERGRVYADPRWRGRGGCRQRVLARAGGVCEWEGCRAPAMIADHSPLPLRDLLARGLDPYDDAHCRALCRHHSGVADGGRA